MVKWTQRMGFLPDDSLGNNLFFTHQSILTHWNFKTSNEKKMPKGFFLRSQ